MSSEQAGPPRRQRVAAYAVITRGGQILLSRMAPELADGLLWTLPGGGIDFGEEPARAVVREVYEETGLECTVGDPIWIGSQHRLVDRASDPVELHSVRLVYDAWVPADAPQPRVVEVDGSTVEAAWHPLPDVLAGRVPCVPMVRESLAVHVTARRQRLAAYALVQREGQVLLTRHSVHGPRPGTWSLPGGGVDHGEPPRATVVREVAEETGLNAEVGDLLGVYDEHFTGVAPTGREEDFHGVALVFEATVAVGDPVVVERDGTVDEVAWVPLADLSEGRILVSGVVGFALAQ